jgi:hypothetical protein
MAWDAAVALGVAFTAASYPSNWPFGGGFYSVVHAWLYLQRTSYGFGNDSLWSLAGSSMHFAGVVHHAVAFNSCTVALGMQPSSSTPSGEEVVFAIKYPLYDLYSHVSFNDSFLFLLYLGGGKGGKLTTALLPLHLFERGGTRGVTGLVLPCTLSLLTHGWGWGARDSP